MNSFHKFISISLLAFVCAVPGPAGAQTQSGTADAPVPAGLPARENAPESTEESAPTTIIDILQVNGLPVNTVLDMIGDKTGFGITRDGDFQDRVTAYFHHINTYDALRIILDPLGLAYVPEPGDGISVMTAAAYQRRSGKAFDAEFQVRRVVLDHAPVDETVKLLFPLRSAEGKIIYYDRASLKEFANAPEDLLRTIILMDRPGPMQDMLHMVHDLDVELRTEIFTLKNKRVQDVKPLIEAQLTPHAGSVASDAILNSLTVRDTPARVEKMRGQIEALDRRDQPAEVLLQAKTLQIILNDEHLSGVDWEAIVSNYQSLEMKGAPDEVVARDELSLGTISKEDYDILLEALDAVGIIHRLSDVKLTIANESRAQISVHPERAFSGGDMSSDKTVFQEDATQIRFFVTPSIKDKKTVTLNIAPRIASPEERLEAAASVKVDDGATVVVGSLFEDMTVESMWKVPLLGDLPLLGFAFRNQGQENRKTELILFLTPQIVK